MPVCYLTVLQVRSSCMVQLNWVLCVYFHKAKIKVLYFFLEPQRQHLFTRKFRLLARLSSCGLGQRFLFPQRLLVSAIFCFYTLPIFLLMLYMWFPFSKSKLNSYHALNLSDIPSVDSSPPRIICLAYNLNYFCRVSFVMSHNIVIRSRNQDLDFFEGPSDYHCLHLVPKNLCPSQV